MESQLTNEFENDAFRRLDEPNAKELLPHAVDHNSRGQRVVPGNKPLGEPETIGRSVVVKVSMPGGYEFEAVGVVRWTREAPLSGSDSPPGFGAQFTQISPEGRQLVYRYVRNREPLFHDDL